MATTEYKTGETVTSSGIYKVVHDKHTTEHEVTCVYGEKFPPCRSCGSKARFVLVKAAIHLKHNEHFKPA